MKEKILEIMQKRKDEFDSMIGHKYSSNEVAEGMRIINEYFPPNYFAEMDISKERDFFQQQNAELSNMLISRGKVIQRLLWDQGVIAKKIIDYIDDLPDFDYNPGDVLITIRGMANAMLSTNNETPQSEVSANG